MGENYRSKYPYQILKFKNIWNQNLKKFWQIDMDEKTNVHTDHINKLKLGAYYGSKLGYQISTFENIWNQNSGKYILMIKHLSLLSTIISQSWQQTIAQSNIPNFYHLKIFGTKI